MAPSSSADRSYFRVTCPAIIRYCELERLPRGRSPYTLFGEESEFGLMRDLRRLDTESSQLLHAINDNDRSVGAYLAVINKKIETMARYVAALSPQANAGTDQTISLSEGGLAFYPDRELETGTILALHITLLPSYSAVAVYGIVTAPDAHTNDDATGVQFAQLQDAERQLIARHVMQVQMAARRKTTD